MANDFFTNFILTFTMDMGTETDPGPGREASATPIRRAYGNVYWAVAASALVLLIVLLFIVFGS